MVPPSQGWLDVMRERRGSGSVVAVGERGWVREREPGERAKSIVYNKPLGSAIRKGGAQTRIAQT